MGGEVGRGVCDREVYKRPTRKEILVVDRERENK